MVKGLCIERMSYEEDMGMSHEEGLLGVWLGISKRIARRGEFMRPRLCEKAKEVSHVFESSTRHD